MSKINKLFNSQLIVINIGLEFFYLDLKKQGVPTVNVNFRPIAGGNKKMVSLLSKLR
ncbi:fdrA domain protein [Clostridium sp. Cult2]|uniref:fdrA domain protein n=1 Tax=Clostridium sp. Cult2 TaxID=2079003 RepID=UPI001F17AA75|nr:fdrA domain protein [Clostridium sp. Cult2]MCF6465449.1 fdrA domain protein [Clostridium sp. Cult2]